MADDPAKDSQLRCPWCGYNMTALMSNRCPECGKRFALARPGSLADLESQLLVKSRSMVCPDCGHNNQELMPQQCANCGRAFSVWERVFGLSGSKPD